jgi:anhydro-N-acetylmuramic acid kinase
VPRDLPPAVVVGLMSGTSADGIDTVTVRLAREGGRLVWEVLGRAAYEYPPDVAAGIRRAMDPASSDVLLITQLHQRIGQAYADAVAAAQALHQVDLVGLSGQTVYHVPRVDETRGWGVKSTLQLGEAAVVAERCRVVTVSDFRQSDLAAGGQGAPLVPFSDHLLYSRPGVPRAVLNVGGIANVTYLPPSLDPAGVLAFDTGPGNCLMDEAAQAYLGRPRDLDGRAAAAGRVDEAALARLLGDPYFALRPPKTTGREHFHLRHALALGWPDGAPERAEDLLATLAELTAVTVADAIARFLPAGDYLEVLVAGGGARNPELVRRLRRATGKPVTTFAEAGYDDKDRETLAMAVMAYMAVHGEPNVLPSATGASHPVVAGKVCRPAGARWVGT